MGKVALLMNFGRLSNWLGNIEEKPFYFWYDSVQ